MSAFNPHSKPREKETTKRVRKALLELPVAEFVDNPAPKLDFVLPGLLSKTVGVFVATGATGKSFFALQLLMSVASGADCFGGLFSMSGVWNGELKRDGEKVVYLSLEDPADVVWGRIRSCLDVLKHRREGLNDAQIAALKRNLKIVSPGREPFAIDDPEWQEYLNALALGWSDAEMDADYEAREKAAKAGETPPPPTPGKDAPRLLVVDTFSRAIGELDENKSGDMAGALAALETAARLGGGAVVYVHHSSKAATADKSEHAHAARGASPLTDNARFAAVMRRLSEEESGDPAYGCKAMVADDMLNGALIAQRERMCEEPRWKSYLRVAFPKLNYKSSSDGVIHFRRGENGILLYARLREGAWVKPPEVAAEPPQVHEATAVKRFFKGREISI
jgi:hypothetical protein